MPPVTKSRHLKMRRSGTTIAEIIVAVAVLAIAIGSVGRLVASVNQGLRDRILDAHIDLELANLRERIGSWKFADISADKIEEMPVSDFLRTEVQQPKWVAEVVSISEPVEARQVTISLACRMYGQSIEPGKLTFWCENPQKVADSQQLEPKTGGADE